MTQWPSIGTRKALVYRRPPDQLTAAEIQSYLLSLIEERKLAFSSCNVALHGLQVTMTFAAVMFGIAVYL